MARGRRRLRRRRRAHDPPNAGAAKVASASASPADFFELTFTASAGTPYRLWMRGKAEANNWANDSVSSSGTPQWRIGTTSAAEVNLEDCGGCGLAGWGWQDNGYGSGALGPLVYFETNGPHTIRVQTREDGFSIDQIVLSPSSYLTASPGALKNDTTILPEQNGSSSNVTLPPPPPSGGSDIVLYAAEAASAAGWIVERDATAAGGYRIRLPDAGAAKIASASAAPSKYFELAFEAQGGVGYRLWIRGKADANHWANDSVFVQFSGSVTADDAPQWRIGTTSATEWNLEDCSGCGVSGWGWQDNGYGVGVMGPLVYFETSGPQTIRIQTREDGIALDQIVLSPATFVSASPGQLKNDTTILPKQ